MPLIPESKATQGTAKICMISLPELKMDNLSTNRLMNEATDEISKVLSTIFGMKINVLLWNTNVKFLSASDLHEYIKQLKKLQKS